MSLITGDALDPKRFFSAGDAVARGSSFDLTIGTIFNPKGEEINGIYPLEPGHMVQVVSAEVFSLPDTVTGHVTYKTALTKVGVWALTIGIIDPGWDGPITTTLLNFSKVPYVLRAGDEFLRVSLIEHAAVSKECVKSAPSFNRYKCEAQSRAVTTFPPTFLNQEDISKKASDSVLDAIQKRALIWIGAIAFLFSIIQWVQNSAYRGSMLEANAQLLRAQDKIESLNARLIKIEAQTAVNFEHTANSPSVPTAPANPIAPQPVQGAQGGVKGIAAKRIRR